MLKKFNEVLNNINDMGLTYKLMNDFKFNTTILQHIINRDIVEASLSGKFEEKINVIQL